MISRLIFGKRIHVAAAGIIEKNGKILLTKRARFLPEGGKWCLPGGSVKFGERVEDAIRREIKEEISLDILDAKFLFYQNEIVKELGLHSVVFVFDLSVKGSPKENFEVAEINWFSREEIGKLKLAFTHKEILNKYLEEER